MVLIGVFYMMTTFLGFGARALLGEEGVEAAGTGGNLAAPHLAQELGGGAGTFGGDLFLAIIAAVAFATILAVVAGPRALGLGRRGARRLVERHPQGPGLRARGGLRRADRGRSRSASIAIAIADHRRRGPERLVHGRPRVRGRRERQLPGAAAGADLAAVQHHGRRHRRAGRRRQLDRPRDRLAEGVAGRRRRDRLADRLDARQPGRSSRSRSASSAAASARCSPSRARRGAQLRRAPCPLRDRPGRGATADSSSARAEPGERRAGAASRRASRRQPRSPARRRAAWRRTERRARARARGAARPGELRPARGVRRAGARHRRVDLRGGRRRPRGLLGRAGRGARLVRAAGTRCSTTPTRRSTSGSPAAS